MKGFKKVLFIFLICVVLFGCAKKKNNNEKIEVKNEVLNDKGQYVYNGKHLDTLKSLFNCNFITSYTKDDLLLNDNTYTPFDGDKKTVLENPSAQGTYHNSSECELNPDKEIDLYKEIHTLKYNSLTASDLKTNNIMSKMKTLGLKTNESYLYSIVLNDLFNSDERLEHLKYQFNNDKNEDYLMVTYNTYYYPIKENNVFEIAGIKTNMSMNEVIDKLGKPEEVVVSVLTTGKGDNKLEEATTVSFVYDIKIDKNKYPDYSTNLEINWSDYIYKDDNKLSYTDFIISSISANVRK